MRLGEEIVSIATIQLVGYVLKASRIITPITEAGIGHYVGTIGFPCVLFLGIISIDAPYVEVLLAIALSKAAVFGLAFLFGAMTSSKEAGAGITRGALFAIFATQSDDVGIGVPVLSILFPGHAGCSLYSLSAMQALVFNPAAYVLLGVGGARAAADAGPAGGGDVVTRSAASAALAALLGLRSNMLVLSACAGLAYRVAVGRALPWWAASPVGLLGQPFAPLVYLIGGFAFCGSGAALSSLGSASAPLAVVALKSVVLPILARGAIYALQRQPSQTQVDFIYLYALLPCANSALVVARLFGGGASAGIMPTLAAALSLNKFVAFALLFLAGALMQDMAPAAVVAVKSVFSYVLQVGSVVGLLWLVVSLACLPAWRVASRRPLALHFVLQLAFTLAFVAILTGTHAEGGQRTHTRGFVGRFTLLSSLRWAVNGSTLLVAVDWARGERARAHGGRVRSLGGGAHLLASACVGLGFTLPWTLGFDGPPARVSLGCDWWAPYGSSQLLAFASAYAVLALGLATCLLVATAARRRAPTAPGGTTRFSVSLSSNLQGLATEEACTLPDALLVLDAAEHSVLRSAALEDVAAEAADPYPHRLRLGIMFVAATIRCGGEAGICAALSGASQSGTLAELLLLIVALEDGQGLASALLFGLQQESMALVRAALSRPACCAPCGGPAAAGREADEGERQEAVLAAYTAAPRARPASGTGSAEGSLLRRRRA